MGWLDKDIERATKRALEEFCAPGGGLEDAVWSAVDKALGPNEPLTEVGFVWALRLCFLRHGSTRAEAADLAKSTLSQYLADEGISFGNSGYAWTRSTADEIADEYELQHWEAA